MAITKGEQQQPSYSPLPPDSNPSYAQSQQQDNYYILLPYRPHRRLRANHLQSYLCCALTVILFFLALFFLWPSDPSLDVVRLHLNHVHPHLSPSPSLDISLALTVKVRNRDFFSFKYDSLDVSIGYRGRELGFVKSDGGFMRARASSYVNATLVLDGIRIIHDVFYLIEDVAKGLIPFDAVTEVSGSLGLVFFNVPIKGKVSCEIYVDTNNQTVNHQNCYPV